MQIPSVNSLMEPPISVGLEVDGTPALGQEFNLTASIRSPVDMTFGANDHVSLGIPEGFEVVSGDTDWTGTTLERGKTVEKKLTLKSVQTGQWTIYQSVCTNATDSGSAVRCALYGYENLYIDVMQDDAVLGSEKDISETIYAKSASVGGSNDTFTQITKEFSLNKSNDTETKSMLDSTSSGTVDIIACFYLQNERGLYEPVHDVPITVADSCGGGLCDTNKWTGVTNSSGCINTGYIANSDELGNLDVYFIAQTSNDVVRVSNSLELVYSGHTSVEYDIPDGIYFAQFTVPSGQDGAFNIFNTINDGANFVKEMTGQKPPIVYVRWFTGCTVTSYLSNTIQLRGQEPGGSSVTNWDQWDEGVILHEYGHHIMNSLAPGNSQGGCHTVYSSYTYDNCSMYLIPGCCGQSCGACLHQRTSDEAKWLAWSEGWASFFSGDVSNNSEIVDTFWNPSYGISEGIYDLEHNFLSGDDNEYAVSQTLWDIFDSNNDSYDFLSSGSIDIWDVFSGYKTSGHNSYTIGDFYGGWFNCPSCKITNHGNKIKMDNIFYDHGTYANMCPDYDLDGYKEQYCGGNDCNDFNPSVNPGKSENCANGIDDDCDGKIDTSDTDCLACDHTSYPDCASAYSMSDGETKGNMCGSEQYYKITTPSDACNLQWTVASTGDYALYARSDTRCPSSTYYTCTSDKAAGQPETCSLSGLPAGTYYAVVKSKGGHESYSINADYSCGCSCTAWANAGCGGGSCSTTQMRQTRTCTPAGCDVQEMCTENASCGATCTVEAGYDRCYTIRNNCANGISTLGNHQAGNTYDVLGHFGGWPAWGRYNFLGSINMKLKCQVLSTEGSRMDMIYVYYAPSWAEANISCNWMQVGTTWTYKCYNYDIVENDVTRTLSITTKGLMQDNTYFVCAVSNRLVTTEPGCGSFAIMAYGTAGRYIVDCLSDANCGGGTPYCYTGTCTIGSMPSIDSLGLLPSQVFRYVETDTATFSVTYTDPENDMVQAAIDCDDGSGISGWTPLSRDEPIGLSCKYPSPGQHTVVVYLTDQYHPGDLSVTRSTWISLIDNSPPGVWNMSPSAFAVIPQGYAVLEAVVMDSNGDDITAEFQKGNGELIGSYGTVPSGSKVTYTWSGLSPGGSYLWHVSVVDEFGASGRSYDYAFTTRENSPPASLLKSGKERIYENVTRTYDFIASDPDGPDQGNLMYAWRFDGVLLGISGTNSTRYLYRPSRGDVGNHTLSASAFDSFGASAGESWNVSVRLMGDVNGDCKVNIVDLATVGKNFGNPVGGDADISGDGVVSLMDLVMVGKSYGRSC
jgi:hypothetical protein